MIVALSACSKRETTVAVGNRTGVLHVGNGAEVQSLDPHLAGGAVDHNVLSAVFEGLITLDEETLLPRPGAAERWDISPDGLVYTFHLKRNGQWSNGDALTARDFLYSFRRALTPARSWVRYGGPDAAPVTTDGPHPETSDLVAGWWMIDVESHERAVELAAYASSEPGPGGEPLYEWIDVREIMWERPRTTDPE